MGRWGVIMSSEVGVEGVGCGGESKGRVGGKGTTTVLAVMKMSPRLF